MKSSRSLTSIAGIVAVATLISKIFGLVRSGVIAAAFGVEGAADAYNYAYVIPGFLLVLLGGINGSFHSAIVSVLAKRAKTEVPPLVETITTLVGGILLVITIALIVFASNCIDLVAPGLTPQIRQIAIHQLQVMAPIAIFSGLIGIGFGTLNAAEQYWLPSISPLFSSLTVVVGLGILALFLGSKITLPEYALLGGIVLALSTLLGAILQWLVQTIAQRRAGMGSFRLRFNWRHPGVIDVIKLMVPATLTSGISHINIYTDLFFASYIPQAAAALSYAGLLAQTPRGILTSMILVPLLPEFSRLAVPEHWQDLKVRIRQSLVFIALTMMPLSALMITLAIPIVRIVYERQAFDKQASELVASVLIAYGIGNFFAVTRDVLVRVAYALGDGQSPFRISAINILINIILDYFFVNALGAPGLVLASCGVNISAICMLIFSLNRQLNGLNWQSWSLPILSITGGSCIAGLTSWGTLWLSQNVWGSDGFLLLLLQLSLSGLICLSVFGVVITRLNLPEVDLLVAK